MGNSNQTPLSSPSILKEGVKRKGEEAEHNDDINQKYHYYLQYLYKNNFISLTYDNLCAYMIQMHWRRFQINKNSKKKKGMIDVIYSSLELNQNVSSHQSITFHILNSKKYPYHCYDLMTYKSLSKIVEALGGFEKLPLIFIDGYYIGSYDHLQELEDQKMIVSLIRRDYMRLCLICNMPRMSLDMDKCEYCYKKYLYWVISNENKYDIYSMRKENINVIK